MDTNDVISLRIAVADLIFHARRQRRLTQQALAERAGVSYEYINKIENYRALPSLATLAKVAVALGFCRISELLVIDPSGRL
jgi:transcriptional regulator with XRE-family HTH domain